MTDFPILGEPSGYAEFAADGVYALDYCNQTQEDVVSLLHLALHIQADEVDVPPEEERDGHQEEKAGVHHWPELPQRCAVEQLPHVVFETLPRLWLRLGPS